MRIEPSLIDNPLEELNKEIWTHGYYFATEDGIWYEIYVNSVVKEAYPLIDILNNNEHRHSFAGFYDLMLFHYVDYNQITFFVPQGEVQYTLDGLSEIFGKNIVR